MADTLQKTITVVSGMKAQITEVPADDASNPAGADNNKSGRWQNWDQEDTLNSTSTPAADWSAFLVAQLSAGALTLDLTSFTDVQGRARDATGKRLVLARFHNLDGNSVTLTSGAVNPYDPLLGTTGKLILAAKEEFEKRIRAPDASTHAVVSSTAKTIDFAGTGAAKLEVTLVFGP